MPKIESGWRTGPFSMALEREGTAATFDVDEYQRLDDAVHEAHEAIYAHVRRVAVPVRGDEPAPRAQPNHP